MIDAEIRELAPQPSAAVRVQQPMDELDLAALFDEHLPNMAHRIADLGVIGCEDAVAGVRRLAVHGPAAVRSRVAGVAQCRSVRR